MNIINLQVSDLIPYENNPRINEAAVDAVANSIQEFGFKVPIVVDENNVIIAGHTRLLASQKLGLKEVPCIVANDLDEDKIKAFRLADNKVGELADWDFEKLQEELGQIETDMSLFDFELEELQEEFDFPDIELDREERGVNKQIKSIKFGSTTIPMTDEEYELFNTIYNNYVDEKKTNLGFVLEIVKNGGKNYAN